MGLMSRVFTNGPGDWGSIPGWVIPKTQNMVLDDTLFNNQHYKVRIMGKMEQSSKMFVSNKKLYFKVWFFLIELLYLSVIIHLLSHLISCIPIKSSSSSCRAACADIPDRLSPFLPIIHRLRQVFRITTRVLT